MSSTPGATICRSWTRSNAKYRIAASAKIASNKTARKKFFLTLFLPCQSGAARFSPSMDVVTFQGLIQSQAGQSSSLETFKINNTRSRQAAQGVTR
jgi:hypothetical protein